jgi:hypothetical protein
VKIISQFFGSRKVIDVDKGMFRSMLLIIGSGSSHHYGKDFGPAMGKKQLKKDQENSTVSE